MSDVILAIIAKSFAEGSILIEVSDKNKGPLLVIIRLVVATLLTPEAFLITSNIGLTVTG